MAGGARYKNAPAVAGAFLLGRAPDHEALMTSAAWGPF